MTHQPPIIATHSRTSGDKCPQCGRDATEIILTELWTGDVRVDAWRMCSECARETYVINNRKEKDNG